MTFNNLDQVPSIHDSTVLQHKEFFDGIHANLSILVAYLENLLGVKANEIRSLADFLQARLRAGMLRQPEKELDVQDALEAMLVGRGLVKGIDYDRETGRVKVSVKESIPDFVFLKLNLALEVKLSKDKARLREIVDEINSDIRTYGQKYGSLLILVYDLGTIRDEAEFKCGLEAADKVSVIVVKH